MIVRATTDYSIRIMVFLATNTVASSTLIASQMEIPQKYLIKIAAALRDEGLITSLHGANGGYALARPAEEITMRDILLAVEPELLLDCNISDTNVIDERNEIVHQMFRRINEELEIYFQSISLADCAAATRAQRQKKGDERREKINI